jgi:hypothetical protein
LITLVQNSFSFSGAGKPSLSQKPYKHMGVPLLRSAGRIFGGSLLLAPSLNELRWHEPAASAFVLLFAGLRLDRQVGSALKGLLPEAPFEGALSMPPVLRVDYLRKDIRNRSAEASAACPHSRLIVNVEETPLRPAESGTMGRRDFYCILIPNATVHNYE